MDFMTKKERSERMALIKSKWTRQERKVHNMLKGKKVRHKMHPKLPGNPDVLVNNKKVIFLQGCFWHKCPQCYKEPRSNRNYWVKKIERNAKRDAMNQSLLKSKGLKVFCFWEHEVNSALDDCINKVMGER